MAAVEALFAAITPSVMNGAQLKDALTNATTLVASMQYHPTRVQRAFYASIAKTFDRIGLEGKGNNVELDLTTLKTALFSSNVEVEALRLLRADAIGAISKSSPTMSMKMKDDVSALLALETSSNVRDRLAQALAGH